jgi:hypothetical protein
LFIFSTLYNFYFCVVDFIFYRSKRVTHFIFSSKMAAPAAPAGCNRTREELDALMSGAKKGDTDFDKYFYTLPTDMFPGTTTPSKIPRCIECGRTIGQHPTDDSRGARRRREEPLYKLTCWSPPRICPDSSRVH